MGPGPTQEETQVEGEVPDCREGSTPRKCPAEREGAGEGLDAGKMCGRSLDDFGGHAIIRGKSAIRFIFHRAVARSCVSFCREAGLDAAEEVVVPELLHGEPGTDSAVEAKLDIHMGSSP